MIKFQHAGRASLWRRTALAVALSTSLAGYIADTYGRVATFSSLAAILGVLLALPGALLGSALAWFFFSGLSASPFGYSFRLDVTPALALLGVIWALVMGFIGGILPALRAARVPVTTALRAT